MAPDDIGSRPPALGPEKTDPRTEAQGSSREVSGYQVPRYSTVTDFARLRGWSTLHPRRTAT
jgi:hypothetical protein